MSFQALKISEVEVGRCNHFKLRTAVLEDGGATKGRNLGLRLTIGRKAAPLTSEICMSRIVVLNH